MQNTSLISWRSLAPFNTLRIRSLISWRRSPASLRPSLLADFQARMCSLDAMRRYCQGDSMTAFVASKDHGESGLGRAQCFKAPTSMCIGSTRSEFGEGAAQAQSLGNPARGVFNRLQLSPAMCQTLQASMNRARRGWSRNAVVSRQVGWFCGPSSPPLPSRVRPTFIDLTPTEARAPWDLQYQLRRDGD